MYQYSISATERYTHSVTELNDGGDIIVIFANPLLSRALKAFSWSNPLIQLSFHESELPRHL